MILLSLRITLSISCLSTLLVFPNLSILTIIILRVPIISSIRISLNHFYYYTRSLPTQNSNFSHFHNSSLGQNICRVELADCPGQSIYSCLSCVKVYSGQMDNRHVYPGRCPGSAVRCFLVLLTLQWSREVSCKTDGPCIRLYRSLEL